MANSALIALEDLHSAVLGLLPQHAPGDHTLQEDVNKDDVDKEAEKLMKAAGQLEQYFECELGGHPKPQEEPLDETKPLTNYQLRQEIAQLEYELKEKDELLTSAKEDIQRWQSHLNDLQGSAALIDRI